MASFREFNRGEPNKTVKRSPLLKTTPFRAPHLTTHSYYNSSAWPLVR